MVLPWWGWMLAGLVGAALLVAGYEIVTDAAGTLLAGGAVGVGIAALLLFVLL